MLSVLLTQYVKLYIVPWGDPNALAIVQRQLDVDILVSGHTHKNEVNECEGTLGSRLKLNTFYICVYESCIHLYLFRKMVH